MGRIKVLIAEDHAIVRQGLRILIQEDPSIEVTGEARTGEDAVRLSSQLHPDVVLMDLFMPGMNGLEATRQIVKQQPEGKVLVLSSFSGDDVVRESLLAGAVGYITKRSASADLLQAIRNVHQGGSYFSPDIARRLGSRLKLNQGAPSQRLPRAVSLSQRETQVLQLIARGLPNKQIADVLGISIKTVEKHRQQLIDKLDIHDTAGLTRYAVDAGLVPAIADSNSLPQKVIRTASFTA
jgi:DNA-binding NarL/FixJ family response regulator